MLDPNAGESRNFTVSFAYPLFDGGNTRAAVRENRALLEEQRRSLDQLEQTVNAMARVDGLADVFIRPDVRELIDQARLGLD